TSPVRIIKTKKVRTWLFKHNTVPFKQIAEGIFFTLKFDNTLPFSFKKSRLHRIRHATHGFFFAIHPDTIDHHKYFVSTNLLIWQALIFQQIFNLRQITLPFNADIPFLRSEVHTSELQ